MTLEKTVLASLSKWRPSRRESYTVSGPEKRWSVQLQGDKCDELGCRLWEMALRRSAPEGATLQAWAERIAGTTTVLEPFKVVEVDATTNRALLRSQVPADRDGSVYYFELILTGAAEATLRRYHSTDEPKKRRDQAPFVLTHEALAAVVKAIVAE